MSFRDAVKAVADDLNDVANFHPNTGMRLLLKSFAKQLTIALASENKVPVKSTGDISGAK
jgi:hypothetical protein